MFETAGDPGQVSFAEVITMESDICTERSDWIVADGIASRCMGRAKCSTKRDILGSVRKITQVHHVQRARQIPAGDQRQHSSQHL